MRIMFVLLLMTATLAGAIGSPVDEKFFSCTEEAYSPDETYVFSATPGLYLPTGVPWFPAMGVLEGTGYLSPSAPSTLDIAMAMMPIAVEPSDHQGYSGGFYPQLTIGGVMVSDVIVSGVMDNALVTYFEDKYGYGNGEGDGYGEGSGEGMEGEGGDGEYGSDVFIDGPDWIRSY